MAGDQERQHGAGADPEVVIQKSAPGAEDQHPGQAADPARQTVNSALKKLVEAGYLRLEAADGNLKNKQVLVTEAGDAFLRRTVDRVFAMENAAVSHLSGEERAALLDLSQKLLDAFRTETERFLKAQDTGD